MAGSYFSYLAGIRYYIFAQRRLVNETSVESSVLVSDLYLVDIGHSIPLGVPAVLTAVPSMTE